MTASLQYSCLGKFHGQRSLAGYSPRGCRESDLTGQLSTHTHLFIWLCWVLTAVRRIFIVMWDLALWRTDCLVVACGLRVAAYRLSCSAACGNLSSLTRDRTHLPCTIGGILNHWTTRDPKLAFLTHFHVLLVWGSSLSEPPVLMFLQVTLH